MNKDIVWPHLMGINTGHSSVFVFDRKPGIHGKSLIMCFRTPAMILTTDGITETKPGDCIIQTPDFRHYHYNIPGAIEGFRNDWLHTDYKTIHKIMECLKLPQNKLISTEQPGIMAQYIKTLLAELKFQDEFSDVLIKNTLFEMLLAMLRVTRENVRKNETMSITERRYYEEFKELRNTMLENCTKKYTVGVLAHNVNLSPERFSFLYKKFFNSTPISDLINARISMAKRILSYSTKSIKETAVECGFDDLYYFSRIFKRRAGCSPSKYQNNI